MTSTAISAIAAVLFGASATIAAGLGFEGAYDGTTASALTIEETRVHAETVFERADLSADGEMSVDEYASLAITSAELARLNGFVAFDTSSGLRTVALPISSGAALTMAERTRIDAVARSQFYVAAGEDAKLTCVEFTEAVLENFDASDRNRNGVLIKSELVRFSAQKASMFEADV